MTSGYVCMQHDGLDTPQDDGAATGSITLTNELAWNHTCQRDNTHQQCNKQKDRDNHDTPST